MRTPLYWVSLRTSPSRTGISLGSELLDDRLSESSASQGGEDGRAGQGSHVCIVVCCRYSARLDRERGM